MSGELAAILCAVAWAVAVVLFKKSGESVSPVALGLFKSTLAMPLIALTVALQRQPFVPERVDAQGWVVLLATGALGVALGDSLYFAALNRLGAGRQAIVECSYSPFTIVWAFIYLGEPIGPGLLAAGTLVIAGIFVGTWVPRPSEAPRDRASPLAGILLGVAATTCWAAGIVISKPVLEAAGSPAWATLVRLVGALPFLILYTVFRRDERRALSRAVAAWRFTIPASLTGTYLAMILWIHGMTYREAGLASVLNQTSSILVILLATIFLKEPLTSRKAIAVVLGVAGGILAYLSVPAGPP